VSGQSPTYLHIERCSVRARSWCRYRESSRRNRRSSNAAIPTSRERRGVHPGRGCRTARVQESGSFQRQNQERRGSEPMLETVTSSLTGLGGIPRKQPKPRRIIHMPRRGGKKFPPDSLETVEPVRRNQRINIVKGRKEISRSQQHWSDDESKPQSPKQITGAYTRMNPGRYGWPA